MDDLSWHAENGRPIHVMGDGSVTRSYMYGSDLGLAMWLLLEKGEHQQIYDVGSDREVTHFYACPRSIIQLLSFSKYCC